MRARRQHGDDNVGVLHGRGRAWGNRHAGLSGEVAEPLDKIVANDLVTGLDQVGGHRVAHVPQPDEGDCFAGHLRPPFGSINVSSPRATKYASTISGVTSATCAGDHFGLRSLSMTAARMPSGKSRLTNTWSAAPYSRIKHSSSDPDDRAARNRRSVTLRLGGDFSSIVCLVLSAKSDRSPASAARISSTVSKANERSIRSLCCSTVVDAIGEPQWPRNSRTERLVVPGPNCARATRASGQCAVAM